MNKLVTHYRNSTQLKKEDLTKKEKEEIISTLNLLKKCESLGPEEREEEFMTMCFNYGLDDDQTKAAKEIFLGIEPSEDWEKNILALERGEWVDSMETKCFKRWNKQRPALLTTLEFIFQCRIPEPEKISTPEVELRLKDSMEDHVIPDGIVGQIAKWINEVDEAENQLRLSDNGTRDIGKRGREKSTPSLIKRNSPPIASTSLFLLPLPSPRSSQENDEVKKKKGKKKEVSRTKSTAEFGSSPPSSPRRPQDEDLDRKAELKRKKSRKHAEKDNPNRSPRMEEEKQQNEKKKIGWVRRLSDRDILKKKDNKEKEKWNRRGSVDSLTGMTITVSFTEWEKEEDKKRLESDTEFRRKRLPSVKEEPGKNEKDGARKMIETSNSKRDFKKDKKPAPSLLCWGSFEDLRIIDENTSPREFSRAMMTRSKESPNEEKRKEIENSAKAKTIEVYQSFKT